MPKTPSPSSSAKPSPSPDPAIARLNRPVVRDHSFNGPHRKRVQDAIDLVLAELTTLTKAVESWRLRVEERSRDWVTAHLALTDAHGALREARRSLDADAASTYMSGVWNDLVTVMGTGNLDDAGRARVYLEAKFGSGKRVLEEMRDAEAEARRRLEIVIEESRLLDEMRKQMDSSRTRIATLRQERDAILDVVVRSLDEGAAAFRSLVAAAQRGRGSEPRTLIPPVAGVITSGYGPRTHPIYGYRSTHTGIDIAVPEGTPVVAPADGVVVESALAGPFGLSLVLDHGGRTATVLSHLSLSFVSRGDRVNAGQVVGLAGCTGWCTGPHVHVEVWIDGTPVDPATKLF